MTDIIEDENSFASGADFCEKQYLKYSKEVIQDRAISKLSDGQKPVQRRIVYSMLLLGLENKNQHKKSARIVGDVIGKYHPHGDTSVYDAMCRLSQDFSIRYPLVDGQGNFGSVDGDRPAAMRYTEAKMTAFTEDVLLADLNKNTVDFAPNFDANEREPTTLPARVPLSIINGAMGIAVGLTADIPSHNLTEVCDAVIHYINNKRQTTAEELFEIITGPDLPTGGQIINSKEELFDCYNTGEGKLKVRGKYRIERLPQGKWRIVFFELPPNSSSTKIEIAIDEIVNPKTPKGKKNISNKQMENKKVLTTILEKMVIEEDKQEKRVVFYPKSSRISEEDLVNTLYKLLPLEETLKFRLRFIDEAGKPALKSIKDVISEWSVFRKKCIQKRTQFEYDKVFRRRLILQGRKIAIENIKDFIELITQSDSPKPVIMEKYNLSELQADDILDMRLRSLSRLEINKVVSDIEQLLKDEKSLSSILGSDTKQYNIIKKELEEIKEKYGDDRRTLIQEAARTNTKAAANLVIDKLTVIYTKENWITFRKGQDFEHDGMNLKSNTDKITTAFNCDTNSIFVVLCENGRSYSFTAEEMVSKGNKEFIHINTLIRDIRNIVFISIMNDDKYLFASSIGYGFVSSLENLYSKNKAGKTFMTGGHVKIFEPKRINDDSYIHLISSENKELAYSVSEIKDLPKGKGVMLMRMTPTLSIKKITVTNKVKNEAILGKRAMTGKNLK